MRSPRQNRNRWVAEPIITSVSLADMCCATHALQAIERAWGVRVALTICLSTKPEHAGAMVMKAHTPEPVHTAELNDFSGVEEPMYPLDMVPAEMQIVSLLLGWLIKLEEHMGR